MLLRPAHWVWSPGMLTSDLQNCFQRVCAAVREVLMEREEEEVDEFDWGSEEEEEEEEEQKVQ